MIKIKKKKTIIHFPKAKRYKIRRYYQGHWTGEKVDLEMLKKKVFGSTWKSPQGKRLSAKQKLEIERTAILSQYEIAKKLGDKEAIKYLESLVKRIKYLESLVKE